ncbi:hypothetical protein PF005_g30761 [Phytophthora fragariae]|uniref:Uncharacterized protein n=1 Tax=Phytophthora fragariae TaxID=53985 RepID=A0A6A3DGZ3_9STRA|nr:hypothetical protein PF003_g21206 [Phytophthora fragariae]KAE8918171.1 hypothetical protein PF009_g31512 [Phytophthora fragariae]KAE8957540.1 hypothetical protein PF011_g31109 [Phytophthora fragariae]KAE9058283.1 hypothetical protein PF007_g31359 [Phytophthora fragariae]KAE9058805.1 hypothetical protein PF010_g30866 [Phytophthora fragariae]
MSVRLFALAIGLRPIEALRRVKLCLWKTIAMKQDC